MLRSVIRWSVEHALLVILGAVVLAGAGAWSLLHTPVDAIPDLSDVQVIVMTEWPGQSPQLVEDQVTYPLETEFLKVPHARYVRGMSQFGISAVYVGFDDGTDLYWARSRVLEYLAAARAKLPASATPMLGPDATGVGWVMQYVLTDTTNQLDLGRLRALQDFTVRPALTAVPGVAEVASVGGFQQEYQVTVDPVKLDAYGIGLQKVTDAVRGSNQDVGARVLELGGSEYVVRGRGRFASVDDIRRVPIGTNARGTAVTVGDVANVEMGPALRRGITDVDGHGEAVSGWVVMRSGANPVAVIDGVKARMRALQRALPPGVKIVSEYDRSSLIEGALHTLRRALTEESIIVAVVAVIFLLHASSALVAILTLPIGVLMAFLAMRALGLSANIMSLGGIAIAIGAMIDAAIVMVENLHKHIERDEAEGRHTPRRQLVAEAAQEVGPALFVSLLIITASFIPVFALGDQEGRLFRPLAWTKTLAMASAALLSITLVPVMMRLVIRGRVRPESANPVNRVLIRWYRPVIAFVLRHRWETIVVAAVLLVATAFPWSRLGSEFMPPLNEGTIMDMPSLAPGIGAAQAERVLRERDAALRAIPEVRLVLGKIGRAESATDMAPMSMIETIAILRDRSEWRPGVTYDSIVSEANARVRTPGIANMWSMPIKNRTDMLATGIKTPVGIRIVGPDLAVIDRIGRDIEARLPAVRGTNSVFAERAVGGRYLDLTVDRAAAARYGLTSDDVQAAFATAVGGADAGEVIHGRERYGVLVRYPRDLRTDPDAIARVLVTTPSGAQVALGELARMAIVPGPTLIKSENAELDGVVYVDVRGRDVGGYVADARRVLDRQLTLPPGYRIEWSGQYEAMQRAAARLRIVVPITLLVIAGLLYANFRSVTETLIVLASLPFALVGGVWLMWILGYKLSVAVAIGFIALAGVAAETGVIMLIYLDQAFHTRVTAGEMRTPADLDAAVEYGAVERVRPKVMTVVAIVAGLLPLLWSQDVGADLTKRIAAPMMGGMLTSAALTLVVIPAIYSLWREWALDRAAHAARASDMRGVTPGSSSAAPRRARTRVVEA